VVVVSTMAAKPMALYVHNTYGTLLEACQSVFAGCTPIADLPSPSLSRSSRLNLWQYSWQIAAICRAAFRC
jgi:hypothetical protein